MQGVSAITRRSANEVNAAQIARGDFPSYVPGTQIGEFVTVEATQLVRVGTSSGGGWFVRAQDITGKTPEQIRQFLALERVPTHIEIVNVPIGTNLRAGQIAAQPQWGVPVASGGVQFENLGSRLDPSVFQGLRQLTPGRRLILSVPVPAPVQPR